MVNYDHKHQQDHYNYPGPCKYNNMSCHVMSIYVILCHDVTESDIFIDGLWVMTEGLWRIMKFQN